VRGRSYLGLDVKNTAFALLLDLADGGEAGAVEVVGELGMLDERILGEQMLELVTGDKVVVLPFFFSRSGRTGRI
jgi:hypothetical protein